MKNLPLFYYPSTWLYVDDDKTLLNCMAIVFEEQCNYKIFSSSRECLQFLEKYISPSTHYQFLKSKPDDENYGMIKHTAIDFDLTKIAALINLPERYHEITAIVIDYHMPEIDGFTLSKACEKLSVSKILLTGEAKEEEVIMGFNQNYIQHYIQKGGAGLEEKLVHQLQRLTYNYFQKITAPLLAHLEVENPLPLSDAKFIEFFSQYCIQKNIREYYLIDKQGSFLCIDKNGKHFYLIIHTDHSINSWLSIYFTGNELSADLLNSIHSRQKIPFFGQGKEAWHLDSHEWENCFYEAKRFEGREKYYWAEISGERG